MGSNLIEGRNLFWTATITLLLAFTGYFVFSVHSYKIETSDAIEIYYANEFNKFDLDLVDDFNILHKGKIKVVPINLSFDIFSTNERKELYTRALRSKSDRIDIFAVDYIWGNKFINWAEPLGKYFSIEERDKFIDEAIKVCYFDDKLYAIPLQIDISLMYYKKSLLDSLPNSEEIIKEVSNSITWEKFIRIGKKFPKGNFYYFPADNYEGLICSYYEAILNQNREFFNGPLDYTRPESKIALNLLVNLVNKYKLTPKNVTTMQENSCGRSFYYNNGVFHRNWPQYVVHLKRDFKAEDLNEFVRAPLPHFEGTRPGYVFGGWNLMISKYSKHKEASIKFIKFITEKRNQYLQFNKTQALPIVKSLYNSEQIPELKFYKKLFKNGVYRPLIKDYTRISDIVAYFVNKAIKKEISVNSALSEITSYIKSNKMIIH